MAYDLLIRGGIIVDPVSGQQLTSDIAVSSGRITAIAADLSGASAAQVADARDQYVTPGLVDLHTHCYWGATYWGIEADPVAARTGVTTWVDAGSAGAYSFPGFRRYVVEASRTRVFAFLHISSIGLIARTYESSNLDYCDVELATTIIEANRDVIVGIKVRMDRDSTRGTGLEPMRRARQLADRTKLPLMVHRRLHLL
jgi:dihydroorotase